MLVDNWEWDDLATAKRVAGALNVLWSKLPPRPVTRGANAPPPPPNPRFCDVIFLGDGKYRVAVGPGHREWVKKQAGKQVQLSTGLTTVVLPPETTADFHGADTVAEIHKPDVASVAAIG